ncbi:MAG: hypothetical protein AAF438_06575 [Pseudomonadota bacterium]
MDLLVIVFGILILSVGIWGAAQPQPLLSMADRIWSNRSAILAAVLLRLLFGLAMVLAAYQSRYPQVILSLGVLMIVAALAIPVLGTERIGAMIDWWKNRPAIVLRLWAAAAALFGVFVIHAMV